MRKLCAVALWCAALTIAPAVAQAGDDRTLERYAAGTWQSFVAMTDEASGLPTDQLHADGTRDVQTSTTNIGSYMWSAVAAERLGHHQPPRARDAARPDRHVARAHGARHGERPVLQLVRPPHRREADDLAAERRAAHPDPLLRRQRLARGRAEDRVRAACRPLAARARALYDSMDFGVYYRPDVNRILFHIAPGTGAAPCCYDTIVSESRIAYYVGIAKGDLPSKVYYGQWRTFPDSCDWSWQETRPAGFNRTYEDVPVYEGTYPYDNGTRLVPSWTGSMFEALMPSCSCPRRSGAPAAGG